MLILLTSSYNNIVYVLFDALIRNIKEDVMKREEKIEFAADEDVT